MTFNRPRNLTLTSIAQWVDSADLETCDQDKLVEYLYYLCYYNAQQRALFTNFETYDDFAIFCVSKLLTRLNNKKYTPIKSVVNYIKTVLTPWQSEYVRCFCCGDPDTPLEGFDITDFADYLVDISSECDFNTYTVCYTDIGDVIRKHLRKIPRKRKSAEWSNIYLSCLLTLQDRIKCAASFYAETPEEETKILSRMIRSLKKRQPVLFHLDETKAPYITVLVNELIHAIANELTHRTHSLVSPSVCLKNLIIAANNDEDT